jgi:hypothetical protein
MSQNEYSFKLKTVTNGEKSWETETEFLDGNIVQDNETSNNAGLRMTVICFFSPKNKGAYD